MKTACLLLALVLAACSAKLFQAGEAGQAAADPRETELRAVLAEADPLVRNVLAALNAAAYQSYVKDFDNSSRAALTETQFRAFQEKAAKKLGHYEEGKFQVHKIEKYTASYLIVYFVKFQQVSLRDPVLVTVRVRKTGGRLEIAELYYKHPLLGS